jgi:hypothetical protein
MTGDGFSVHSFFHCEDGEMSRMSPFFLVNYGAKINFSPRDIPRGVGVHPNPWFETVTIGYHANVAQWMTVASGKQHKEYHDLKNTKKGGSFQMVQLLINLPAAHKMSEPNYRPYTHEQMEKYELPDGAGYVHVIAGDYQGAKGPALTFTPIQMYNAHVKKGRTVNFSFPANYNTGILIVEGGIIKDGANNVEVDNFILFKNDGEDISVTANEDSVLLVLSGEPILEPIMA